MRGFVLDYNSWLQKREGEHCRHTRMHPQPHKHNVPTHLATNRLADFCSLLLKNLIEATRQRERERKKWERAAKTTREAQTESM